MSYTSYVEPPDIEDHPLIGREINYSFQPYNSGRGVITRVQESDRYESAVHITVKVLEGTERNRLFGSVSTPSNAGAHLHATGCEKRIADCADTGAVFVYVYPV